MTERERFEAPTQEQICAVIDAIQDATEGVVELWGRQVIAAWPDLQAVFVSRAADVSPGLFDIRNDELRLMAGEMTAQEMRTVRAVLNGLKARAARLVPAEPQDPIQERIQKAFLSRFNFKENDGLGIAVLEFGQECDRLGWQAALASRAADAPEPDDALIATPTAYIRRVGKWFRAFAMEGPQAGKRRREASELADEARAVLSSHAARPADVPERVSEPLTDQHLTCLWVENVHRPVELPWTDIARFARAVIAAHEASRAPASADEQERFEALQPEYWRGYKHGRDTAYADDHENEKQLCRIAEFMGGDATKAPESDRTIAGFVIAEVTKLRAAEPLCMCKDRPLSKCPGEWEPGCDLGNNEKYMRVVDGPKPHLLAAGNAPAQPLPDADAPGVDANLMPAGTVAVREIDRYCNKCGYCGPQVTHCRPQDGRTCRYKSFPLPIPLRVPTPSISERVVESKPGAALHVERLELTDAGREALTTQQPVQLDAAASDRIIMGALRDCIKQHGPIDERWLTSAAKRVRCQLEASRADSKEPWIGVKDRMPELHAEVLLWADSGSGHRCELGMLVAGEADTEDWSFAGGFWDASIVTHWMPLPVDPTPKRRQE